MDELLLQTKELFPLSLLEISKFHSYTIIAQLLGCTIIPLPCSLWSFTPSGESPIEALGRQQQNSNVSLKLTGQLRAPLVCICLQN